MTDAGQPPQIAPRVTIEYTPAGPTLQRFHHSAARVRAIMGPRGSSKSVSCCAELMARGMNQKPFNGVRRTRFGVVRKTYGELQSTTIKTWMDWYGPVSKIKQDKPVTIRVNMPHPDGQTKIDMEILFVSIDHPDEVTKLMSMELTGAWLNEVRELDKAVLDDIGPCLRYPSKRMGGATWHGIIMDTNPPDDDHWFHTLFETERPKGWALFRQPGGLVFDGEKYLPNPQAENIQNLTEGYDYYFKMIEGKSPQWIKVFVLGEYGTVSTGRPVYLNYRDSFHVAAKMFEPMRGVPLLLGWDFGRRPSCLICQLTPRGQLRCIEEFQEIGMGLTEFATTIVAPHLVNNYGEFQIVSIGDPAGASDEQTSDNTCMTILADAGIPTIPGRTNDFTPRFEAVDQYLRETRDGEPGLLVSPECPRLRKGLNGAYCFERVALRGQRGFRDKPKKDEWSDLPNCLEYVADYTLRGLKVQSRSVRRQIVPAKRGRRVIV